ncbi:hypothetical protein AVEN_56263-1 [Araneus ventricosus]|uniref:RNA-directed DNA polymerase from mobile element jockey n=1 Tax=Araneus ventricosus TaxID=182803 RepID=A0A4Y2FV72_ARAVE|nr:hypothetical protein AVEN_56263-1 [Araneus ventricosus]
MLIYTAILRPVLTYVSPVWSYAADSYFNQIDRCQNIILRQISKATWFMRNEDIRKALEIPHIEEFIKNLAEKFFDSRLLMGSSDSSSSCMYTNPVLPQFILAYASRPDSHGKLAFLKIPSASSSKFLSSTGGLRCLAAGCTPCISSRRLE